MSSTQVESSDDLKHKVFREINGYCKSYNTPEDECI